ncbi:tyrosine-type recombinase/integrase [Enterobacter kobei]|uniref:tyrosine-type recombinase/integrase n=1 Tax=Enterobacter kobei TaxID=208224 RepID=UPI003CF68770
MNLTVRQIDTAKPADRDYKLTDGQGLYLLVKKSGAKYWCLKYRFSGKEKKLSIGVYPTITLAQARAHRESARKLLAEGRDPSLEKQAKKRASSTSASCTFKIVAQEWFDHKARQWTPRYLEDQIARIENNLHPVIGNRPVSDIKPMEILECLRKIETEGKLETLRKTRQLCVQIFDYAIATGRTILNPASSLNTVLLSPVRENNRALSESQLPEFIQSLKHSDKLMALATYLLLLTALRSGELRLGRWEEIDFEQALWHVPMERMKMRRPHVVPLSRQALALLRSIKESTAEFESEYIFPGVRYPNKPRHRKCLNDFLQELGWHHLTTAHGFRHTFSTIAHDNDCNSAWIELQLAHVDKNSIRGTYNHAQYLDGRREMMQWYADHIDSLSRGK